MIINDDILRRDTIKLLRQIDAQIEEVEKYARQTGVRPEEVRGEGGWAMSPLLLAKAQAYSSLIQLQKK